MASAFNQRCVLFLHRSEQNLCPTFFGSNVFPQSGAAHSSGAHISSTYSAANDAHRRFDCSQAADKYGQVAGFYALALPSHRATALERRAECLAVLRAEDYAQDGSHQSAAELYADIIELHAASPILGKLRERRAEELLWWGDSLMEGASADPEHRVDAVKSYETVLLELSQTSRTDEARRRIDRVWASADSGDVCGRADSILELAGGEYSSEGAQVIKRRAAGKAPTYMLGCGNRLIAEKRYRTAIQRCGA